MELQPAAEHGPSATATPDHNNCATFALLASSPKGLFSRVHRFQITAMLPKPAQETQQDQEQRDSTTNMSSPPDLREPSRVITNLRS
mgnify:CR=1 FL=1